MTFNNDVKKTHSTSFCLKIHRTANSLFFVTSVLAWITALEMTIMKKIQLTGLQDEQIMWCIKMDVR